MSLTICIRFLTGRAHMHPWQTHHSEGRVEWPPSQWRLLRALVAVAGRGLTSLPYPDDMPPTKPEPVLNVGVMAKPKVRGVPPDAKKKLSFSKTKQTLTLNEQLTDAEAVAWNAANPDKPFAEALEKLRQFASAPNLPAMADVETDKIPLSRLAQLLHALSATPSILLPKSYGGHTRQYFPIHSEGIVKNSGSPVFDTFATVQKDHPLLYSWPAVELNEQLMADLKLILGRMTYFGRAESWCRAEVHACPLEEINVTGMSAILRNATHWECICIEDGGQPAGKEYRDYLLERRLAPIAILKSEVAELFPRTKGTDGKSRKTGNGDALKAVLQSESSELLLLRCLLRESGHDIKDGLERPIGTRWVHYAVPRVIFDVPRPNPRPRCRHVETVDLVCYALNTATVNRAVLPSVTDTLRVADKFRGAVMALCREPSRALSGHDPDGSPCKDHQHAFWWPLDDDNDGFIDHAMAWAPGGFEQREIDALRRLTRLRQRGGRPDLLVTPTFAGQRDVYKPWQIEPSNEGSRVFVSATPYFCPIHLSHGRGKSGRFRRLRPVMLESLKRQSIITSEDEVFDISEIVFDYRPEKFAEVVEAIAVQRANEPIPPRQFLPVIESPQNYSPPREMSVIADVRYSGAVLKDADEAYCVGSSIGLVVNKGSRFIRALSYCRRRREHELRGRGRMLQITFVNPRAPQPFAIGSQCHFGMGLFVPTTG